MGGIYNRLPLSIKNYKSHDFSLVSKFLLNSTADNGDWQVPEPFWGVQLGWLRLEIA